MEHFLFCYRKQDGEAMYLISGADLGNNIEGATKHTLVLNTKPFRDIYVEKLPFICCVTASEFSIVLKRNLSNVRIARFELPEVIDPI